MSRLSELMEKLCPDGVEFVPLWSVTIWDKKFNAVERYKQPVVDSYQYLLANDLFLMEDDCGDVFLLSTGEKTGWTTEAVAGDYLKEGEVVSIPWGKSRAVTDCIKYYKGKFVTADNRIATSSNTEVLSNKYLYYWMMSQGQIIDSFYRGSGIKHPDMAKVLDMQIPVPPLPIQNEIVKLLDNFTELTAELTAELQLRKKQYNFYRENLLKFPSNTKCYKTGDIFNIQNGYTPSKKQSSYWQHGTIPWYRMEDIRANGRILYDAIQHVHYSGVKGNLYPEKSILMATTATIGEYALLMTSSLSNQQMTNFSIKKEFKEVLDVKFAFYYFHVFAEWCKKNANQSGGMPIITTAKLKTFSFPIPPLEVQQKIVSILDRFDALCNDLTQGLPAEIAARKKQYEYYRDKLLTFRRKGA